MIKFEAYFTRYFNTSLDASIPRNMKHCFNFENSSPIRDCLSFFLITLIIYTNSIFIVTRSERKWLFVQAGIRVILSFSQNHHFLNNVWLFPVFFRNNVASTEIRFSTSDGASTTVLFPSPFLFSGSSCR